MPSLLSNSRRLSVAFTCVAFACNALAQSAVFDSIKGDVQRNGARVGQGQEAVIGSTITTAENGQATIRFEDGQRLAVGSNTTLVLERYVYNANRPSDSASWLNLIRGGLRYVSGALAKANPNAFRLSTPTATVGIRGSIVSVAVIPSPVAGVGAGAVTGAGSVSMQVIEGIGTIANGGGSIVAGAGSVVSATGALAPALTSLAALPAGAAGILQSVNAIQLAATGAATGAGTTAGTTGGATGGTVGASGGVTSGVTGGITGGVGSTAGTAGIAGAVGAAAAPATIAGVGLATAATATGLAAAAAAAAKALSNNSSTVSHH